MKQKSIFLIIGLLCINRVSAQVPVIFGINDLCKDSIEYPNWEVVDVRDRTMPKTKEGTYILSPNETYFVSVDYYRNGHYDFITFIYSPGSNSLNRKIITIPKIHCFYNEPHAVYGGSIYVDCNGPCNGTCIDYHENGTVRLKGKFSEGRPRGKLRFYRFDGSIEKIEVYNRKGKLKKVIWKESCTSKC